MAAPRVFEQDELRRDEVAEGIAEVGARDVVTRTQWQLFWLRFRQDGVALVALGFIVFLILVAVDADRLYSHPSHPYTRALLAAVPAVTIAATGRQAA